MRIVHVITGLEPYGAESVVASLVEEQAGRGHDVAVATLTRRGADSPVAERVRRAGRLDLGAMEKVVPWHGLTLGARLRALDPEVVHAHLFHANLLSRLAPGRPAAPLVNTIHNSDRRPVAWRFRADRWTHRRCAAVTAVSAATARFYAGRTGLPREAIRVVRNGIVPPSPLAPDEVRERRERWGVADCARVVGGVGRLTGQKGFDRLLDLLPRLAGRVPPGEHWGIVLLGEGRDGAELRRRAAAVEGPFTVRLPGFEPDAGRSLGAFDVLAVPSRFEGYGLVAAEAMAHGLPVVAQDRDSLPEVLEGYAAGALVDFHADDPAVAVEMLARALLDPPERCPARVRTVSDMADDYLRLYAELPGRA